MAQVYVVQLIIISSVLVSFSLTLKYQDAIPTPLLPEKINCNDVNLTLHQQIKCDMKKKSKSLTDLVNQLGLVGSYDELSSDNRFGSFPLHVGVNAVNSSCELHGDLVKIFNHFPDTKKIFLTIRRSKLGNFDCGLPTQLNGKFEALYLNLVDCNIEMVPALESIKKSGFELLKLHALHLNRINLIEIPEKFFIHIPNLNKLFISNNNLENINEKSFEPLANSLESIALEKNKLKLLPKAFLRLRKIKVISIRDNPLELDANENIKFAEEINSRVHVNIDSKNCKCNILSRLIKAVKSKHYFKIICQFKSCT